MACIYCEGKLRTTNSRATHLGQAVWRRRKCSTCNAIYTTEESPVYHLSLQVRHPEGLQPFSRLKLQISLQRSLSHRRKALEEAEALYETCIQRLIPCPGGVLEAYQISQTVSNLLNNFDKASATHYQAHHEPS